MLESGQAAPLYSKHHVNPGAVNPNTGGGMTLELKRIPLGPVVKVGFLIYFAMTLVLFLVYSIFLGGMMEMVSQTIGDDFGVPVLTGGALIFGGFILAIFLSVLYTLITLLAVILYNAIASFAGGIEFEMQDRFPSNPTVGSATIVEEVVAEPVVPEQKPPEGDHERFKPNNGESKPDVHIS